MTDDIQSEVEQLISRVQQLTSRNSTKPTLVYFDIIGIGWPIRCLLYLKDIDYELIQISFQHWWHRDSDGKQLLKSAFRNLHVPLYIDDQVMLNQSNIIMMHLAEKHDFLGDNYKQKLAALEVSAHAYDALFQFSGLLQVNLTPGISDDVVQARLNAFMGEGQWGAVSNGYKNNLDAFENYLDANSTDSGFMVGARLSIADLHAFNVLCNWYKAFDSSRFVSLYPRLDTYIHRIAAISKVKQYIQTLQEPTTWFQLPEIALKLTSPDELKGLID